HLVEPGLLDPGRIRGAADPARPESPGRAGPGPDRAGPRRGVADAGRYRVPGEGGGVDPVGAGRHAVDRRPPRRAAEAECRGGQPRRADRRRAVNNGRQFDAVLFDFGGVLVTSPFALLGSAGEATGVGPDVVLELMMGDYAV